jgi:hypothetical protein
MATILVLKSTNESRATASRPATSAEIILFPGVRYERWQAAADNAPKVPRKRRSRVKRDRMDIVI